MKDIATLIEKNSGDLKNSLLPASPSVLHSSENCLLKNAENLKPGQEPTPTGCKTSV